MAVKYVKDFAFDSGFGFSGSSGKTPVKSHMRSPMKKADGGAVKSKGFDNSTRNPISKFPDIAPAMVEKRSKGLGGLASETKKLAAYDRPHAEGKKGAKVAQYAKGGAVKAPTDKERKMPEGLPSNRQQEIIDMVKAKIGAAPTEAERKMLAAMMSSAQYAKGGAVKKAHAKKEMSSFLKAKMMKKAEGGPVAEITEGDGMSPLQEMAYALPYDPMKDIVVERELPLPPEFNEEGMRVGPDRGGSRMYDPTRDAILEQTPPPLDYERMDDAHTRMTEMNQELMRQMDAMRNKPAPLTAKIESPLVPASKRYPAPVGDLIPLPEEPNYAVPLFGDEPPIGAPLPPSPLARAAMPTKADRMATRRDNMMAARDIMDRYVAGNRNAMPRRSMAPGMRGMAESKARRAMPVAPREPMIQLPRAPRGGVATFAKGGKVSKGEKKIGKVMGEFKRGELHSGSKKGPVVTNPKQATAIALSEARAAGAKIPKKKAMGGRACG